MAKKTANVADATNNVEAPITLTPATQKLVDAIRAPFTAYIGIVNTLGKSRAELAGPFMKACRAWRKEMGGASFIDFVRELDPTVPEDQPGYRNNPVYNAAVYLKRLVEKKERAAQGEPAKVGGPEPATPLAAIARLIAAIKPLVPQDNLPKLWEVIAHELHWNDQQKQRLQNLVDKAQPLLAVRAPKGQPKPVLHFVAPPHRAEAAA